MRFVLALAALLALPGAAAADEGDDPLAPSSDDTAELITAAQHAYDELNYDKCLSILSEIEKKTNLKTWEKITVLKYRAFIHINTENDIFARDAIVSIYNLDPAFTLPDSEPPKILKVFADVKGEFTPRKKRKAAPPVEGKEIVTAGAGTGKPAAVKKEVSPAGRPNLLVRFWPGWAGLAAGVALFTPGVVFGATAASDRSTIENAPRDAAGHIIGITRAQAQAMQNDANSKALTGNILMGAGAAAAVAGGVLFLFYDNGWHEWRGFTFSFAPARDGATMGVGTTW